MAGLTGRIATVPEPTVNAKKLRRLSKAVRTHNFRRDDLDPSRLFHFWCSLSCKRNSFA
jgi:hypothetical protein